MGYFLATATAALLLPAASQAFLSARQTAAPIVSHSRSKTCVFQQQQLFDQDGNPIYDQYGNPMYYDPEQYNQQQQQQQQYYDQGQQQQQQYYDQQQQQQQPNAYNNEQEQPSLIISDNMQEEMARATAGVDVGMDFLALAQQRAANRVESNNSQSSAEDWFEMAEAKKRELGGVELKVDWENWDPADAELDEREANAAASGVQLQEGEGGVMMTEGGLVVDNVEGEDGPQLML
mmetsp:Transcript_8922/g.19295  ORF Transcript_8922/g.19295 Transcript_8922/m.19295 type:complete len:234 (-) Transcript_8922:236-937(-)